MQIPLCLCDYFFQSATIYLKIVCFKTQKVKLTDSYTTAVDINFSSTHSLHYHIQLPPIEKSLNQPNKSLI